MKTIIFLTAALTLSACTIKHTAPQETADNKGEPSYRVSETKAIAEIRKLSPESQVPLKIAVMPSGDAEGLSAEEVETIKDWGREIEKTGFAEKLEIVPKAMIPSCTTLDATDCFFSRSREVGARMGADAVLFLSDKTTTNSQANPFSILNITIIGAWLVPAHHRNSHSVYEASLFDINSGYLYAVSQGSGKHSILRPLAYADKSIAQNRARLNALADLGEKLTVTAKGLMEDQ